MKPPGARTYAWIVMEQRQAILMALALACLACVFVLSAVVEGIYWYTSAPPGKELRAALPIRDNVTPFQRWGVCGIHIVVFEALLRRGVVFHAVERGRPGSRNHLLPGQRARTLSPCGPVPARAYERVHQVGSAPSRRAPGAAPPRNNAGCHNQSQGPAWL